MNPVLAWLHERTFKALPCRGCLGPLDPHAQAGLCSRCWAGLMPLPENRCPICALVHPKECPCPENCAWSHGDALWDYHGGRPALGALLIPGIKHGELGWRRALLHKLDHVNLPEFLSDVHLITSVPSVFYRRFLRGFDLAQDAAETLAHRLRRPYKPLLFRRGFHGRQALKKEHVRRQLPRHSVGARKGMSIKDPTILLIDDVWTTGTTLLRCAQTLQQAGAREIRVLSLFRAL